MLMTRKAASLFLISVVLLYLVGGNALRVIPLPVSFGNINVGEVLLYFSCFIVSPFFARTLLMMRLVFFLILVNALSLIVGLYKFGFQPWEVAYNLRLSLLLFSSSVVACAVYCLYDGDVEKVMSHYARCYAVISFLAMLLLVMYPDSVKLWEELASLGIIFEGDPHKYRLVSTYFDPNFFATIIVLPIALSSLLYMLNGEKRFLCYLMLMVLALVLTVSRSGISLLVLFYLIVFASWLSTSSVNNSFFIRKSTLRFLWFSLLAMLALSVVFNEFLLRMLTRFSTTPGDLSAYSRLESFKLGVEIFFNNAFLGYGYNFSIQDVIAKNGKIDSSAQMLFISYGILGGGAIFVAVVFRFVQMSQRFYFSNANYFVRGGVKLLGFYLLATFFWAGNFNQVVFYQFWLLPIIAGICYYELLYAKLSVLKNASL